MIIMEELYMRVLLEIRKRLLRYWREICREESTIDDLRRNMSKYSLESRKF